MKTITQIAIFIFLFCACSSKSIQGTSQPPLLVAATVTKTDSPQQTVTHIPPPTATAGIIFASKTPDLESLGTQVVATLEAAGPICKSPAKDWDSQLSPDKHWLAMDCRGNDAEADSYLQVISIQGDKSWSIHYADYARGTEIDRNNMIYPFHWSADGKYLFATSPSRADGCCWIGGDLVLIRLNLESGEQTEIANYANDGDGIVGVDFSISPSDRYALYIPQDGNRTLYILDFITWKLRLVKIRFEYAGAGYTLMSNDDKNVVLLLREYPKEYQGDLTYGSIVIINLESGLQRRLLSGMLFEDTPRPAFWKDNDHVQLQGHDSAWLLNIHTQELTKIAAP